jgi:hypothetical protein
MPAYKNPMRLTALGTQAAFTLTLQNFPVSLLASFENANMPLKFHRSKVCYTLREQNHRGIEGFISDVPGRMGWIG